MVHLKNYGVFVGITIFSSALARCLRLVNCPCGISNTSFSFCLDVPLRDGDTCARWANCATCRNYSNECLSCPVGRSGASCDQIINFGNEDSTSIFLQKRQNRNETASSNSINYKRVRKRSSAFMLSCLDPGPVENAKKKKFYTEKQDFFPGEKVGYVCRLGYALVGEPVLRCLKDSQWSAEVPECHYLYAVTNVTGAETSCSDPGEVENADIIWRPQAAMFSCHNGYVRVGPSVLRCVAPGRWDGELPRCIRPHRRQGSVATSFDFDTLSLSECLDTGELDNADRYTDGLPENTYFHTISYRCAPGYAAVGSSVIKCLGNDRWSSDKPKCEKVELNPQASVISDEYDYEDEESDDERVTYCLSPGPIDNGHWTILSYYKGYGVAPITDDDEFPERTRLKYFCDSGYSLVGRFPTMHCQHSGLWSRETPFCHLDCGYSTLHSLKKVHLGVHTEPGEWPWTVAISKISGGFSKLICGGSLLDNRTVLTAAHCLMDPEPENTADLRLYFGKYNRSVERDDIEVVTRTPSVFMIHPQYDAETKDNDIALIRIAQPIKYTSRIRPVCLPTTKTSEQNLKSDISGYVVGWGTTERNRESEELLMAIVPVVPAPECRSAFKRQNTMTLITPNMFCAGFAEGGVASCKGDSGGPLVFHDPETDRHTVEGIVSFGRHRECGMPGRYTVYTQVSRYLDWIKESMAASMCDEGCQLNFTTTPCPSCNCSDKRTDSKSVRSTLAATSTPTDLKWIPTKPADNRGSPWSLRFEVMPTSVEVNPGDSALLTCKVDNRPVACVWFKDEEVVGRNDSKYEFLRRTPEGDCSIRIRNGRIEKDDGLWQCLVTQISPNDCSVIALPVKFTVREPPLRPQIEDDWNLLPQGEPLSTLAGKKKLLRCISRQGNPPATLKWTLDDEEISSLAQQTNTIDVDKAKTWKAVSVLNYVFEKGHNGKMLRCMALHEAYDTRAKSIRLPLNVSYAPEIRMEGRPDKDVEEGSVLSVKCIADSNPKSNVIWKKNDSSSIYGIGERIRFRRVNRSDSGVYSCLALNTVGASRELKVDIDVKYRPYIWKVSPQPGATVSIFSRFKFECEAEGNPPPKYSWLQKVDGDPVAWEQRGNASVLQALVDTYQYQGQYVCEASNTINERHYKVTSAEITLDVTTAVLCSPPKCDDGCHIDYSTSPCPSCSCEAQRARRPSVMCSPPKCDPGCQIDYSSSPCPVCSCDNNQARNLCSPPKCGPGCRIDFTTSPCPNCKCDPDMCSPPKCGPGCLIDYTTSPCPNCKCDQDEKKYMCSPPKCGPGCLIDYTTSPCPNCKCDQDEEKYLCPPPKCGPGCHTDFTTSPCPNCKCDQDEKKYMCSPPKCGPGCRIDFTTSPCPNCKCDPDVCSPPKCGPVCHIDFTTSPCPNCKCDQDEKKYLCSPPKCGPGCRVDFTTSPCPICKCDQDEKNFKFQ